MAKPALYQNVDKYIRGVRGEFEEKLATLVEIPSISMDPECTGDIKRCGEAAAEFLRGHPLPAGTRFG